MQPLVRKKLSSNLENKSYSKRVTDKACTYKPRNYKGIVALIFKTCQLTGEEKLTLPLPYIYIHLHPVCLTKAGQGISVSVTDLLVLSV